MKLALKCFCAPGFAVLVLGGCAGGPATDDFHVDAGEHADSGSLQNGNEDVCTESGCPDGLVCQDQECRDASLLPLIVSFSANNNSAGYATTCAETTRTTSCMIEIQSTWFEQDPNGCTLLQTTLSTVKLRCTNSVGFSEETVEATNG